MDRLSNYIKTDDRPTTLSGQVQARQVDGRYVVGLGEASAVVRGEGLQVGASVQLQFDGGAYHVVGQNPGVYRAIVTRVKIPG